MIQAQPHLCSVVRLRTDRVNTAQSDVNTLLELYRRSPRVGCNNPIIAPVAYHPLSAMQPYLNYKHPSHPTTTAPVPSGFDRNLEMPGFTPSSSAMDASEVTEADPDLMDP